MVVDLCDTVIVTVKPVETPVRLVLLDTGITSSLSERDLRNLKQVFTAVIIGDVSFYILSHLDLASKSSNFVVIIRKKFSSL